MVRFLSALGTIPPLGAFTSVWSKVSGPGTVTFDQAGMLTTLASFSTSGIYTLELSADDSGLTYTDAVTVTPDSN